MESAMDLYVDELKKVSEGKEIQVHISFVFTVVNFGLSCFTFYVIKWQMYFCCCFLYVNLEIIVC